MKTNPEYEKILPPLTNAQYNSLKSSIKETGKNLVPIIVNENFEILDGYHRYRACLELELDPKIEIKEFSDPISEKEFVININLNRRQLNSFQISEMGYKLEEIEREKAKMRQLKNLKNVGDNSCGSLAQICANEEDRKDEENEREGKVSKIIADKIGQATRTYERNKKIIEEGSDEQKEELRKGRVSTNKVYNKIRNEEKKKDFLLQISNNVKQSNELSPSLKLVEGDFSVRVEEITEESIDLILTDPNSYSYKNLDIYYQLGSLAEKVLKPGSSFVTAIELYNLPQILEITASKNLYFWWIIAIKINGYSKSVHQRNVDCAWKPYLWFVKGEKLSQFSPLIDLNNYLTDFIELKSSEKTLHKLEQSTIEAEHIIKNLTIENQTILDPLMGHGTVGIASLNLKRKFIGIEHDHEKFLKAKTRLAKIT